MTGEGNKANVSCTIRGDMTEANTLAMGRDKGRVANYLILQDGPGRIA
jgi:hypothetical protein